MGKSWRWMALGAVIGLALGWILLRRRLTQRPQLEGARQDEGRNDRIVLPMSRAAPPDTGTAGGQGSVKGEITLPDGITLTIDESEPHAAASSGASATAWDASNTAEAEDDRIELPLHGDAGRPLVGEMNGAHQLSDEEAQVSEEGDQVEAEGDVEGERVADAAVPDGSVEAYCVRCKTQRPMVRVTQYVTSKNRAALKGECAVCGAGMFKFIKE